MPLSSLMSLGPMPHASPGESELHWLKITDMEALPSSSLSLPPMSSIVISGLTSVLRSLIGFASHEKDLHFRDKSCAWWIHLPIISFLFLFAYTVFYLLQKHGVCRRKREFSGRYTWQQLFKSVLFFLVQDWGLKACNWIDLPDSRTLLIKTISWVQESKWTSSRGWSPRLGAGKAVSIYVV